MPIVVSKFEQYAENIFQLRHAHVVNGRYETWEEACKRVWKNVVQPTRLNPYVKDGIYDALVQRKLIPGGRILSQAGRPWHMTDNCFMLRAHDSREGLAELSKNAVEMFLSGGGVGIDYSDLRSEGETLKRTGGVASGPIPFIRMIDSIGECAKQGGERRAAIYGSLKWNHPDVGKFIYMKNDGGLRNTNISVRFDNEWYNDYVYGKAEAKGVFEWVLRNAFFYGDPGFQFDMDNQVLRNACTEVISADHGDSCCLGSINLARIEDVEEMQQITQLGVAFLLCNTLYTDTPNALVNSVKRKNRRLGLGIMGFAEWFMQRGLKYGDYENCELKGLMYHYKTDSRKAAKGYSEALYINEPIAVTAIAPTGTISISGGRTTPGIEPIFHTKYRRFFNTPQGRKHEDVIDPCVSKFVENGYNVKDIETAYSLSQSFEGLKRRIDFQTFLQEYVDNGISSTVNIDNVEHFEKVKEYLPDQLIKLRGITFYPNGRHGEQPIVPLKWEDTAEVSMQQYETCRNGICGV